MKTGYGLAQYSDAKMYHWWYVLLACTCQLVAARVTFVHIKSCIIPRAQN